MDVVARDHQAAVVLKEFVAMSVLPRSAPRTTITWLLTMLTVMLLGARP